ncbi:MAG: hypothetical protein Q7S81_00290 [bacterium]|nr:hypothetical protein [bacterium]
MADDRVRLSRVELALGIFMMAMTLWGGVSCLNKSSEMNTAKSSNALPSETTVK